jgi:hypothetical protein
MYEVHLSIISYVSHISEDLRVVYATPIVGVAQNTSGWNISEKLLVTLRELKRGRKVTYWARLISQTT